MADISKITLPSGSVYDIKDSQARADIASIQAAIAGGVTFMGATTTALIDGSTATTIIINGNNVTAVKGYLVAYNNKEFIFDGTKWLEFGDLGAFKALAYKDTASATYTPAGSVSKPTFTGSSSTVTITASDNTNGNYQPKGTVSQPTFTGSSTTSTGKFTPSGSVTVTTNATTNKTATVSSTTGTATYTPAGTVSQPTFDGTGVRLVTDNIAVPNTYKATFTGTEDDVSVAGTPAGTVSQPIFTGTKAQLSGTTTAAGSVSQPTFTGTEATITVS